MLAMAHRRLTCLAAFALIAGVGTAAAGDVTLWVSHHFQGTDSYEAGKYRDAEALFTQAEGDTCAEHRLAFTLDGKGMAYTALGQYADAEECLKKAMCLRKESCGPESRFVSATLNNLADLHYIAGDKDKVECLYRKALELNEDDLYSIEVGRSLNGLALVANDAGNAVEAENLLKRAMRVHMMGNRSEHPYMATVMINLGALYTSQGRYDEAKCMLRSAEHIQDTVLGCEHPDVAVRLQAEASLLSATGCLDKAKKAQNRAEEIEAHFADINK